MLAKWLSIRQGPVKVAQRHRSERYPENPRLSSAELWPPTSPYYAQYIQNNAYYVSFIWTHRAYQSDHQFKSGIIGKIERWFRPSLWFLVPPPFSSTSPNKPLQLRSCHRLKPSSLPRHMLDTGHNDGKDATKKGVLPSVPTFCPPSPVPCWRSPPKLAMKMETQPCVGGPQMRRRHTFHFNTQLW